MRGKVTVPLDATVVEETRLFSFKAASQVVLYLHFSSHLDLDRKKIFFLTYGDGSRAR